MMDKIKPWREVHRNVHNKGVPLTTLQQRFSRVLVVCVDFPDKTAQISISDINNRFFSMVSDSMSTFYNQNSYGYDIITGEVHGWYRMPQNYNYYCNNDYGLGIYPNNAEKLIEDAIDIAVQDTNINLSYFDFDNDNEIEYLVVLHAGAEAASTGSTNDFWAHVSTISPRLRNGYRFQYYMTVSEYMNFSFDNQKIGIDCHEFGHLKGLADLYDSSGNSNGAGYYSLMAQGSWANGASTPTHLDAFSKYFLGYSDTIINPVGITTIKNVEEDTYNYLITTDRSNEFFMIENRQNVKFDQYIPGAGILIWKVNTSSPDNSNEVCYRVGLIQADGLKDLENAINYGDGGDPYPGTTNNRMLTSVSSPSNILCDNSLPWFSITDISDSGNTMTFLASCTKPYTRVSIT